MVASRFNQRKPGAWPGRVHSGFWDSYMRCSKVLGVVEDRWLRQSPHKSLIITVTGHSGGGAVGALLAGKAGRDLSGRVRLITFGSPMVGDAELCSGLHLELHRRVYNRSDPVPQLFPGSYVHLGQGDLVQDVDLEDNLSAGWGSGFLASHAAFSFDGREVYC